MKRLIIFLFFFPTALVPACVKDAASLPKSEKPNSVIALAKAAESAGVEQVKQALQKSEKKSSINPEEFAQQLSAMLQDPKVKEAFAKRGSDDVRFKEMIDLKKEKGKNPEGEALYQQNFLDNFYKDYLMKYYPKVFAMRQLFTCMKPKELERCLHEVTMLFARTPARYFMNNEKDCKVTAYWEHIVDQCSFISDFLKRARVDLVTKEILIRKGSLYSYYRPYSPLSQNKTYSLFAYLKRFANGYIFDFYALCFDYLIKLFNEGILLRDLKQTQRYLYELEFVAGKLRESRYESEYQEAVRICKELTDKLKRSIEPPREEAKDMYESSDPYTRELMKEAKMIGYTS